MALKLSSHEKKEGARLVYCVERMPSPAALPTYSKRREVVTSAEKAERSILRAKKSTHYLSYVFVYLEYSYLSILLSQSRRWHELWIREEISAARCLTSTAWRAPLKTQKLAQHKKLPTNKLKLRRTKVDSTLATHCIDTILHELHCTIHQNSRSKSSSTQFIKHDYIQTCYCCRFIE